MLWLEGLARAIFMLLMVKILHGLIEQDPRNCGSIVHIYVCIYVYCVMQDLFHQQYNSKRPGVIDKDLGSFCVQRNAPFILVHDSGSL